MTFRLRLDSDDPGYCGISYIQYDCTLVLIDMLATGEVAMMDALAARENTEMNEISRILPLAFLAPDMWKRSSLASSR